MSVVDVTTVRTYDVDPQDFRRAFRRHAAGVAVVTFMTAEGPRGFTATSVTSVSLQPPLVSFAVSATSSTFAAMSDADSCVIHLLGHEQDVVARRFAQRGVDRFAPPIAWSTLPSGEPLLAGATAWLRCAVRQRIPVGDHTLVIAEALEVHEDGAAPGLVYHDGLYHPVGRVDD